MTTGRGVGVAVALLIGALAIACGGGGGGKGVGDWADQGGDGGDGGGGGSGQPITLEEVRAYYENDATDVREGLLDGLFAFMLELSGLDQPNMDIVARGDGKFDVTAAVDLDGDGSIDAPVSLVLDFEGDPTDGLDKSDLPVTVTIDDQLTSVGRVTTEVVITVIGTSDYTIEGTMTVMRFDDIREDSEFGYTVSTEWKYVPVYGWKEITWSRDGSGLSFDVTSDSGADGRQYTKIQLPNGGPVVIELGMRP